MALFKCKMCGGDLEISEGVTIAECEYCGTKQTLPKTQDEKIANLFNRANRLRMHCEFDKAEQVYEKIIDIDDTEAEAHWGLVLCKYGIEYVEDPDTLERIPTCHRTSYEAVTEDNDYLMAIENASAESKGFYVNEAKRIEELQKDVLKIVKDEKPFDVFICYKESDEQGERTPDSVLAEDIFEALTDKGYRVFFSRITLEEKLGREYEPYIFAALNSAKVMLVVGTKPAYMDAVWVRNEWSRYLKIMKKDSQKLLIPCYMDMDPYDMPEAFSHLQSQNMQKLGAIQDLVRGIGKIIKADNDGNAASAYATSSGNLALIDNAMSYLKDGNFAIAATTCNQVLKSDPQNGMAYVGLLMAELKITDFTAKEFNKKKYKKNPNYQNALDNADEYIKEKFTGFDAFVAKKKKTIKKCLITIVSLVLVVCLIFLVTNYVVPEIQYIRAKTLMNEKKYSEAYGIFIALNGYKDSNEKANFIVGVHALVPFKNAKVGDYISFGSYEQDNNTSNGKENIEWLVLDIKEGKVLALSKYALDCKEYHRKNENTTWEKCDLRQWLNNEFFNSAFSDGDKAFIQTVTVSSDKTSFTLEDSDKATQDRVFLLSITETNQYLQSNSKRSCMPTKYAVKNGVPVDSNSWWLRSPGDSFCTSYVEFDGDVNQYGRAVNYNCNSVRPAMWIDLSQIQ